MNRPFPKITRLRALCADEPNMREPGRLSNGDVLCVSRAVVVRVAVEPGALRRVEKAITLTEASWPLVKVVIPWLVSGNAERRVTLGVLRAWAGPHVGEMRCPNRCVQCSKCKGTGTFPGTHQNNYGRRLCACRVNDRSRRVLRDGSACSYPGCDYKGRIPAPRRAGGIEGLVLPKNTSIDRNLVARVLAAFDPAWDDASFTLRVQRAGTPAVLFSAPDVTLLIAVLAAAPEGAKLVTEPAC